jgi:IS30 family transposase
MRLHINQAIQDAFRGIPTQFIRTLTLDNTYVQTIVQALNNRPRKILIHRTPAERFQKLSGVALHP